VAKMFEKFPGTGAVATSGRDRPIATDRWATLVPHRRWRWCRGRV